MRLRNKIILTSLLTVVGLAVHLAIAPASANAQDCERRAHKVGSYTTSSNYLFIVIWAGVHATNPNVLYNGSSNANVNSIDSRFCGGARGISFNYDGSGGGNYGGSATNSNPNEADLIELLTSSNPGDVKANAVFNWEDKWCSNLGSCGWIRPDAIQIGHPKDAINQNGNTINVARRLGRDLHCIEEGQPAFANVNPNPLFSVKNCNNYGQWEAYGRQAAAIDDSGRLVLGSNGVYNTIWCSAYDGTPDIAGWEDCGPDVQTLRRTDGTYAGGNGYLFRKDQCIAAELGSCWTNRWDKWYTNYINENGFIGGLINREPTTNYLNRFYLHYQSRNTGDGGFSAGNYFTLRYPLNGAKCTYSLSNETAAPGTPGIVAELVFENTGTRYWRSAEGYHIEQLVNGALNVDNISIGSGLVAPGSTRTVNVTFEMPAGGASSINWRLMQRDGRIVTCGSNSFEITPTAAVNLKDSADNPNDENPVEAVFDSGYLVNTPNPINGLEVERTFYIRRYGTGAIVTLNPSPLNDSFNNVSSNYEFDPEPRPLPSMNAGDEVCIRVVINLGSGAVDVDGNAVGSPAAPLEVCDSVVNKPYVRVFGQDVFVGGGFGPANCTNISQIKTFYYPGVNRGSGTQFAAFALGQITQFMSASQNNSPLTPAKPYGLSFANDNNINPMSGNLGGNFGTENCVTNFWSKRNGAVRNNMAAFNLNNETGGSFIVNTPTTLRLSPGAAPTVSNLRNAQHYTLYVDGNVYIDGDIVYQNNSWGSESEIPSLLVVANGDIFIDSNVREITGIFVAQPKDDGSGSGGNIYTCASFTGPYSNVNDFLPGGRCSQNRLWVHGTFVAQNIKLLRTIDSLRNSRNPDFALGFGSNAAENISFGNEFYLSKICQSMAAACGASAPFDAMVSLPPIL